MYLESKKPFSESGIILKVIGEVTIGEGDTQLREVLMNAVNAGYRNVILNMAGITEIDNSGIGELVGCYTTMKKSGGKLKLLHLPAKLNKLLQETRLITVFEVYDSEKEAVASFGE